MARGDQLARSGGTKQSSRTVRSPRASIRVHQRHVCCSGGRESAHSTRSPEGIHESKDFTLLVMTCDSVTSDCATKHEGELVFHE